MHAVSESLNLAGASTTGSAGVELIQNVLTRSEKQRLSPSFFLSWVFLVLEEPFHPLLFSCMCLSELMLCMHHGTAVCMSTAQK